MTLRSTAQDPARQPAWVRYGLAALCAAAGWLAREALTPAVGPTALPFISFFPAIALATWLGGVGPGITATVISGLLAGWGFTEPVGSFSLTGPGALAAFLAFALSSAIIISAIGALRITRASLVRELAERRHAETELAASHHLLATTLASIGDGVIVTDEAGRVTFLNRAAEALSKWTSAEAAGRSLSDVVPLVNEDTRSPVESPVDVALRQGKTVGLANHTLLIARDGTEVPIDDSAAPIRRPGGPIAGAVLVFRDVREQRQAQSAQTRLASIVTHSVDAIMTKDLDGIIRSWNAGAERLFGYAPDEIIGKPVTTLMPTDRRHEEDAILAQLRKGEPIDRMETVRVAKNGRRLDVFLSTSPLKDRDGRIVGASKIVHDISDVVAARRDAEQQHRQFATTLASIGDGVIVTDVTGRVRFVNPEAERLTGWTPGDAVGKDLPSVFRIVNELTGQVVENPVDKVLRLGQVVGLANHTILIGRDGTRTPIDDSAAPIKGGEELLGVVLVFRDITERWRASQALQEADKRKDEFLAILSHELRNPLAPIRLAVTMLQKVSPGQRELQDLRDVIDRQTSQMARLLDDLLDVSRITSGKIVLRKDCIGVAAAVASAVEASRLPIESFGHQLSVTIPDEPMLVEADLGRLAQVFTNLLNNGAKYTERGGRIALTLGREGTEAVVRVRDNGIGLHADQIPRIFEMFAQMDQSLERGQGGLGVGLALAKRLVELHGGSLQAHSDGLGKGSEFVVRLPLLDVTTASAPENLEVITEAKPLRILVADDNRDAATCLAMMLQIDGHTVHEAYDGQEALNAVERERPDVALLDIGMPGMNGYDVARSIRAQAWGHDIVLVALTGWGKEDDKRRALDAGFNHHLTKPVESLILGQLLDSIADSDGASPS